MGRWISVDSGTEGRREGKEGGSIELASSQQPDACIVMWQQSGGVIVQEDCSCHCCYGGLLGTKRSDSCAPACNKSPAEKPQTPAGATPKRIRLWSCSSFTFIHGSSGCFSLAEHQPTLPKGVQATRGHSARQPGGAALHITDFRRSLRSGAPSRNDAITLPKPNRIRPCQRQAQTHSAHHTAQASSTPADAHLSSRPARHRRPSSAQPTTVLPQPQGPDSAPPLRVGRPPSVGDSSAASSQRRAPPRVAAPGPGSSWLHAGSAWLLPQRRHVTSALVFC